jgi:mannose-6-phosphate isomerase
MLPKILQLTPEYRNYVWGGERLRPGVVPTAEAWVVAENDLIACGALAGRTLANLAGESRMDLLGRHVYQSTGERFPLLIKLLDCAQWLSIQVHPSDEQARKMEGPGQFGKSEAWHVLEASPEARLIAGLKPGVSQADLEAAMRTGAIQKLVQYLEVYTGDTIYMPAGTIHALGPGLLIYEVQENSDLTYRVYDWDRPQAGGRVLHIDQSLAVANPAASPQAIPAPELAEGGQVVVCRSTYFTLRLLAASRTAITLDTAGETFHALTVMEGVARIIAGEDSILLNKFQTALIPAATGVYHVQPIGQYRMLAASIEPV